MRRPLFFLISALMTSLFSYPENSQEMALKIEKYFFSLQSFKANFEQTYYSVSVSTPLKEKGTLYFKKPDLMRWEYKDPEEKIFVSKEGIFLSYLPEDNQLIRRSFSDDSQETEILFLLSGKRKLMDYYLLESSPFPSAAKKSSQLKLTPREEGEYSYILLEIDQENWLIRRLIFFDWAGNKTEFSFSQIKTDIRISRDMFELKVPADCEILEDSPPRKK